MGRKEGGETCCSTEHPSRELIGNDPALSVYGITFGRAISFQPLVHQAELCACSVDCLGRLIFPPVRPLFIQQSKERKKERKLVIQGISSRMKRSPPFGFLSFSQWPAAMTWLAEKKKNSRLTSAIHSGIFRCGPASSCGKQQQVQASRRNRIRPPDQSSFARLGSKCTAIMQSR